jgi:hypothetical protein
VLEHLLGNGRHGDVQSVGVAADQTISHWSHR